MPSRNADEKCETHLKSDKIEIMIKNKADKNMEELFESHLFKYQIGLEESMKGNTFIMDYVGLLHCKCHKTNPNCCGSYIVSLDWIKNKKTTINPINKNDGKCFQDALTVAVNLEKKGKKSERISEIESFIDEK